MTDTCELCRKTGQTVIVDGRTREGYWAWMCMACHRAYGVGLGTGRGQLFDVATGTKLKG